MPISCRVTPLESLAFGILAGAAGAAAQSFFFKLAAPITPENPKDAFQPAEQKQKGEHSPVTVARRFVEDFAKRGPLSEEQKSAAGTAVHYGFGSAWGGLYGLARESTHLMAGGSGALGFSAGVWMLADNVILPTFRLAAWPRSYPLKTHAFALMAHVAYGIAVWGTYEAVTETAIAIRERLRGPSRVEEDAEARRAQVDARRAQSDQEIVELLLMDRFAG